MSSDHQHRLLPIEWEMMDTRRFLSLSFVNTVSLRFILYPLVVIRTRLQVQRSKYPVYSGTFDAFAKILRHEGINGLYRGFVINTMQITSGFVHLFSYEKVRHLSGVYGIKDTHVRGLIGGGVSALLSQTINIPFDVVSQHMMVISDFKRGNIIPGASRKFSSFTNPLLIKQSESAKYGLAIAVIRELYRIDGFRGFYRGYFASLTTYVPGSALWWMFYPLYTQAFADVLLNKRPASIYQPPHLFIHMLAGATSGATVSLLTNPLDVIRVNVQVQRTSYRDAFKQLWQEEGPHMILKGLSARMTNTVISSAVAAAGYETIKRWSLKSEFKNEFGW